MFVSGIKTKTCTALLVNAYVDSFVKSAKCTNNTASTKKLCHMHFHLKIKTNLFCINLSSFACKSRNVAWKC